jgi:inhibitor of KinA
MNTQVEITTMGHQCLLLQWQEEAADELLAVRKYLHQRYDAEILESVPAFHELAVYLHEKEDLLALLKKIRQDLPDIRATVPRKNKPAYLIPTCYDPELAPDLEDLAKGKGLSVQEVIDLHSSAAYQVLFTGFLPGFPYLQGLDKRLYQARLTEPRRQVAAGSVGIADGQTGIYPQSSPGGWNIIGNTPLTLFDHEKQPPALLQAGDRVQFFSIDKKNHQSIKKAVDKGSYKIEVSND